MDSQWERAVIKLVEQTESGILNWEEDDLAERAHPEFRIVGPAYSTLVNDKKIAIFEYRYKSYDDDGEPKISTNIRIEFVSSGGEKLFVWPQTDSRYDLLNAIRERSMKADEFLTQFLATN